MVNLYNCSQHTRNMLQTSSYYLQYKRTLSTWIFSRNPLSLRDLECFCSPLFYKTQLAYQDLSFICFRKITNPPSTFHLTVQIGENQRSINKTAIYNIGLKFLIKCFEGNSNSRIFITERLFELPREPFSFINRTLSTTV